jgi:hypothetical protein
MIVHEIKDLSPAYSRWLGKSVVLVVTLRQCRFPLPCSIIGESASGLRVRINPGWEMNVRKDLILAIEDEGFGPDPWVN